VGTGQGDFFARPSAIDDGSPFGATVLLAKDKRLFKAIGSPPQPDRCPIGQPPLFAEFAESIPGPFERGKRLCARPGGRIGPPGAMPST